jgi:hypothetical protein
MRYVDAAAIRDAVLEEMLEAGKEFGAEAIQEMPHVALGVSRVGDEYQVAVRVIRMDPAAQEMVQRVEARAKGEIDLVMTGEIRGQQWHRQEQRPLLIGSSCANRSVSIGTLCCLVEKRQGGARFLLSNNHVFARTNLASTGESIAQPAFNDQTGPGPFGVGRMTEFVRLQGSGNVVDAALASPLDGISVNTNVLTGFPAPLRRTPVAAFTNQRVFKIGRTTGLREGKVRATGLRNLPVTLNGNSFLFDDQIEIEPVGASFSEEGDSGSLVFDSSGSPVGLLFAGNDDHTFSYANPIGEVLDKLKVDIVA